MNNLAYLQYEVRGQRIDRKRATIHRKKIAEQLSAFAIAEGDVPVIGNEDDGELTDSSILKQK